MTYSLLAAAALCCCSLCHESPKALKQTAGGNQAKYVGVLNHISENICVFESVID